MIYYLLSECERVRACFTSLFFLVFYVLFIGPICRCIFHFSITQQFFYKMKKISANRWTRQPKHFDDDDDDFSILFPFQCHFFCCLSTTGLNCFLQILSFFLEMTIASRYFFPSSSRTNECKLFITTFSPSLTFWSFIFFTFAFVEEVPDSRKQFPQNEPLACDVWLFGLIFLVLFCFGQNFALSGHKTEVDRIVFVVSTFGCKMFDH